MCAAHGGSVGRVKAAAGRRVADQQARELARRADIEVPEFSTPGTAARYLLAQAGARALQFGMLADQQDPVYADEAGRKHVHPLFAEERRWLELLGKTLSLAVQAAQDGGSEAERSALVGRAIAEALSALGPLVRRQMYVVAAQGDVDAAMAGLEDDVLQVAGRMAERGRAS